MRVLLVSLVFVAAAALVEAQATGGSWGRKAPMLESNSEFTVAQLDGKVYVLGGYPASRQTQRTVQVYDTKTDSWTLGPPLPVPNNHGMAAAVGGKVYLIGGQTTEGGAGGFVNTVYALDPRTGVWESKAPMPTARSAGSAVVLDGKIYVAGGRPPRGADFAVYDPATDRWSVLPDLPSQRNHIVGFAANGRLYFPGGRLEAGFQSAARATTEAFDPRTNTWTSVAPMPRPRSGFNGVMAYGCFHAWGGEGLLGMFADHDIYDPRTDTWTRLAAMPVPVHGVAGAAFADGVIYIPGGGLATGGSSGTVLHQTFTPTVRCE